MTRTFIHPSLGEVDREIPIPVSKRIGVIVQRHLEARTLNKATERVTSLTQNIGSNALTNQAPAMSCS
jgi:hypothetical protein